MAAAPAPMAAEMNWRRLLEGLLVMVSPGWVLFSMKGKIGDAWGKSINRR
jgi:hypothetical protein